jgi:hypothetical protein
MISKELPSLVTHLDIIKTIAVIVMVIDHLGMYFFPDITWFRAIGRIGMPVWFFMVGYARGRDLPNRLLIGALVLAVADIVFFNRVFPMNALVTIIALRFTIDLIMGFILRSRYIFVLSSILMTLFYVATNLVVEYGTLALMFACVGYLTRHKDKVMELTFVTNKDYVGFSILTFVAFCLFQNATFQFDDIQFAMMGILTFACMAILMTMRPMTFPQIKGGMVVRVLQYCGRNTLDIYVAHLLVFKVILFASLALK